MRSYKKNFLAAAFFVGLAVILGLLFWQGRRENLGPLRVVLIQKAIDDTDFWTSIYEGGQMAADELGVELTIMGPKHESEAELQHQMILDAIAEKPHAIALTPSSFEETIPYAEQIEAAGISLVLMDSTMKEDMGESLIATDNYAISLNAELPLTESPSLE